jgi:hypothetical protein
MDDETGMLFGIFALLAAVGGVFWLLDLAENRGRMWARAVEGAIYVALIVVVVLIPRLLL